MLWTCLVILLVFWLVGMARAYTMGGFIHVLPAVAIIAVLVRLYQSRRAGG
jgi:hypothetical protein